ncbi:MAG: YidC/Oxa1 family insertase periplasmic-domain containing protein, partial [Phycisphaerales bacterium]
MAAAPAAEMKAAEFVLGSDSASPQTIVLGASDPNTEDPELGFKLQLVLSSKGASIKTATFSDGDSKGFDNRNPKDPKPLVLLKPVRYSGGEILSMSNNEFVFVDHKLQLRLNELNWECFGVETTPNGCQKATFTAVIKNQITNEPVIKLTKTYALPRTSYTAYCNMTVENLSDSEQNVRFNLNGPVGMEREGVRTDMRKVIGGFQNTEGQIVSSKVELKKLRKPKKPDDLWLISGSNKLMWASTVNKYFAAAAVPLSAGQQQWVAGVYGRFFNPDGDSKSNSGDETIGFEIKTQADTLAAAGQQDSSGKYDMELYLGPKDKKLFDENNRYKELGLYLTIDFVTCCCPTGIIQPLAFGILWLMNVIYSGIPNYG